MRRFKKQIFHPILRGQITLNLPCSMHLDARPIYLMRIFPFRATSCTLRGDLSPHASVFISCNKLHATRQPIPLMSVFSFRAISCMLRGDLPTSCVCFHFVQQVARYEETYPPMRVFSFVQHIT